MIAATGSVKMQRQGLQMRVLAIVDGAFVTFFGGNPLGSLVRV